MASSTPALITPRLVRWARERIRYSHERIAKRIQVSTEQVILWEEGRLRPTFKQARDLAKFLNVPFGYLYLSSPPKQPLPLPDLRTRAGRRPPKASPEFLDLLDEIIFKQRWYKEFLKDESRQPLGFVGRFGLDSDFAVVASDIASTLGINQVLRAKAADWEEFLTALIRSTESSGILVFRNSIVGTNVFRKLSEKEFCGFAISDPLAPVIFINSRDYKTAQIFTLAHELAHIWLGESGISDMNLRTRNSDNVKKIERLCNRIAAEILVPEKEFQAGWQDAESLEANLRVLARTFRVSGSVILRRAYELGKLAYDDYIQQLRRDEARWRRQKQKRDQEKRGDIYTVLQSRNSGTLTRVAVQGAMEGKFLHRDIARLLGVSVSVLDKIAERL